MFAVTSRDNLIYTLYESSRKSKKKILRHHSNAESAKIELSNMNMRYAKEDS